MSKREQALANLARANAAKMARAAERAQARRQGLLSTRHLQVLVLDRGATANEIAAQLRFCSRDTVGRILRRADVRAERERIVAAQRERLIAGDFGVAATARAAAPKAIQVVTEQVTDPTIKPGDRRKAAELTLKVAGELQSKTVHEHVHRLIGELTLDELEEYQRTRRLPQRVRDSLGRLGVTRSPRPRDGRDHARHVLARGAVDAAGRGDHDAGDFTGDGIIGPRRLTTISSFSRLGQA